jgi:hypothetical protein
MKTGNRVLLLIGSNLMLSEMAALIRGAPGVELVEASHESRRGGTFRVTNNAGSMMLPVFPRIRSMRDASIPKIIRIKQPLKIAHTNSKVVFTRSAHDTRASVPRTKPRKRNGSR